MYVEYTGTALSAIFKRPVTNDRSAVLEIVREQYAASGRTMLPALGFNNTFAMLVRGDDARRLRLRSICDAVPHARRWRAGFGYEFLERADGFPGLSRTYGLQFAEAPRVMDLSLTYRAVAGGQVDMIAGDATAGLIAALDLAMLEDDRHYFPPYDAVPVVHAATLLREPRIRSAIERLAGQIREADMRSMNYAVEGEKRDPAVVVRVFWTPVRLPQGPSASSVPCSCWGSDAAGVRIAERPRLAPRARRRVGRPRGAVATARVCVARLTPMESTGPAPAAACRSRPAAALPVTSIVTSWPLKPPSRCG